MSDTDMYQKQVKRRNLLDFFLDNKQAQIYITTHMFGDAVDQTHIDDGDSMMNDSIQVHDIMNDTFRRNMLDMSVQHMNVPFLKNKLRIDKKTSKITKMNPFQTYMALIKAYVGIGILGAPKAFDNGGMALTTISLMVAGFLSSLCALKLIRVGQKLKCFSFS